MEKCNQEWYEKTFKSDINSGWMPKYEKLTPEQMYKLSSALSHRVFLLGLACNEASLSFAKFAERFL